MSETKIGEIALLQVHGDEVKLRHRYDPTPLIQVDEASVDVNGMLGWTGSAWVVDVHHMAWPNPGPRRPLSIGFTSHYDKMRDRYWDIALGAAAENVIVATDRVLELGDLGERIIVRGEDREVVLLPVKVAKPCLQFTSYMLELNEVGEYERLRGDLDFLGAGTRGFIVTMDEEVAPTRLRVGDEVFVA
jgi:hypothetical protein